MTENTEEQDVTKRSLADTLILLFAVFIFFGTWIEVAINTGLIGIVLGWIPGLSLSFVWLFFTGRLK